MDRLSWWHVILFLAIVFLMIYVADKLKSKLLLGITCVGLVCVSGLRHGYIDTRAYRLGFENLKVSDVLNWDFLFNGSAKDRGFSVLSAFIKLFSDEGQVFLFIMAFVTVSCLFWGLINNTPNISFAVFLFITTGCYLDTMNGLRQALVSSLLFFLIPQMLEKKLFFRYFVLTLVMSTIHGSALLFIPLYFVVTKKQWSVYTWGILGVTTVLFTFFNSGVGNAVASFLEGTTYGEDYGQMLLEGNSSVNIIRIFVAAVPLLLSYMTKQYKEKDFLMYRICFNMSLVNFVTWLFATKVLYFYRLAMYFQPYMILLLCYEVYYMRREGNKRIVLSCAVVLFLIWHIYSLYTSGESFFVGYLKY